MSFRSKLAQTAGRFTKWSLKKIKRNATSLPGKVALTIDPNLLDHLTKNLKVIMITGTNGKTLTTSLITHVLKQKYSVITNESGSNMVQGITSTLLDYKNEEIAILEVDEANLKKLTPVLHPEVIVFTNVFRDQMDRFGEIYTTYQYMVDGAKLAPSATLIVNGDTPIFNHDELTNPKQFFGFSQTNNPNKIPHYNTDGLLCPSCHNLLEYHLLTYSNLGDYYCSHCGFKRPHLDAAITSLKDLRRDSSDFEINNEPFHLEVGGLYNIYNALAAYSVGKHFNVSSKQIRDGFNQTPMKFGRQESFKFKNKEVVLNLVKNPVGFNQIVDLIALDPNQKSIVTLLNDNYADGIDVSWIWDADYEKLNTLNLSDTLVSGIRRDELELRLKVAGFENVQKIESLDDVINRIEHSQSHTVYVLATYTALLQFRELLSKRDVISKEMK